MVADREKHADSVRIITSHRQRKNLAVFLAHIAMHKALRSSGSPAAIITAGILLGLLAVPFTSHQVVAADIAALLTSPDRSLSFYEMAASRLLTTTQRAASQHPKRANFELEQKSQSAERLAHWIVDFGDNQGMPFLIVDKPDAKVFAFHPDGRLWGAAPALLGMARGDDSMPGIGDRSLSEIPPEDRTTPAGRFVAYLGQNFHGKDILWVDYDGALSLHRVVTSNPKERRLERLATPTPLDNRISWGCINVPVQFFNEVVIPAFKGTYGVVYVLPETRSNREIFASYYVVQ